MLDYRIETFLTVCKYMNYTKAAQKLNITQPNVSQHIRWIEQLYQVQLFRYSQRKLTLTPAGEALYRVADAAAHEEHLLRRQLDAFKRPDMRLSFGITRSINEGLIKDRIIQMMQAQQPAHLIMTVDNTEHLLGRLKREELDFAIVEGNFSREFFDSIVLSKEKFIPVCAEGKYPDCKRLRLEDLKGERLIIREEGSGSRRIMESILESRNMDYSDFSAVLEIGDIETILRLVEAGQGISFLYESAVEKELKQQKLKRLPLTDLDVQHNFCLIWLKTVSYRARFEAVAARLMQPDPPNRTKL